MRGDSNSGILNALFQRLGVLPRVFLAIFLAASLGGAGGPLQAQESTSYVQVGGGWRQGDYGTSVRSTLWMGYATLGAARGRWDASLTVPTLQLAREEGRTTSRNQGLGDILLRGTILLWPENEAGWSLDGTGVVKLPTASESAGLGTGRTDGGGFFAVRHRGGAFQWTFLGGWIRGSASTPGGSPEALTPGGCVLGLGLAFHANLTRWELSVGGRGSTRTDAPGAREVSLGMFHPFSSAWGLQASFTAGLNDGGPRRSADLALIRRF